MKGSIIQVVDDSHFLTEKKYCTFFFGKRDHLHVIHLLCSDEKYRRSHVNVLFDVTLSVKNNRRRRKTIPSH